jgi:uncharacterized membrane-anchored protein YitT (DUF2179 family)
MTGQDDKSNNLYRHLVENSIFTPRQASIIYKRLKSQSATDSQKKSRRTDREITAGAYYRQVRQCREKVVQLVYSAILVRLLGAVDEQTFVTIERLADQLGVIFSSDNSDISDGDQVESVISVMDSLVKKICKV